MAYCKYCGAYIEFKKTSRSNMPVDPDLVMTSDLEAGDLIVMENGTTVLVGSAFHAGMGDVQGYQSHFNTCPDYKG